MKKNAKEYLKEFANSQPNWLKALIYETIESNGNISDDKKDEIFACLKDDNTLTLNEPNIDDDNLDTEIHIVSLEHVKGVNALCHNQTIKFHKDITILYGLNGAGKSSYFKVLNEIAGGNQKKEVLSNIYLDTPQSIDVKVSLKEKAGQIKEINWNGSDRSVDLFNKCKVFDSSYLNGLLATRKADATLIQPLGLNLFSYLVDLVDEFKDKLKSAADKKRLDKPTLELIHVRDNIKLSFENHNITEDVKKQVEDLFVFSEDNAQKLTKVQEDLSAFRQINIQDKIKLKTSDKSDIDSIKNHLESAHKKLLDSFTNSQKALEALAENREANELAKKQFEILSKIPNSDTLEWKEFIKSGEKYRLKVEDGDKVCIYCRQPLQSENSTKLIQAYGEFLKDESEQKLSASIEQIDDLKKSIEGTSIDFIVKPNIKAILEESKDETTQKTLFETIETVKGALSLEKEKILKKINNKELDIQHSLPDITGISEKLKTLSEDIGAETTKLSEDDTKKAEKINKLGRIHIPSEYPNENLIVVF